MNTKNFHRIIAWIFFRSLPIVSDRTCVLCVLAAGPWTTVSEGFGESVSEGFGESVSEGVGKSAEFVQICALHRCHLHYIKKSNKQPGALRP